MKLEEGLFKKRTAEEKAEIEKYKQLKKKYNPLRKRIKKRLMLGTILGAMLFLNSTMGWHHISPELYNKYQQYNNEIENRIEQLEPEAKANFEKELNSLKAKLHISDDTDINQMSYKDFVNFVDKKKNLLDNEDYKGLAIKGIQVGSNTAKNIKNGFGKLLNKFGIRNPFEGTVIKTQSPFYVRESKMTFREYIKEAEERKKNLFFERVKGALKKTVAGILLGAGLALSVANANAAEIVENRIPHTINMETIEDEQTANQMMVGVAQDTYEALKDAGITAYDKATETAKDLTRKGINLANNLKNKAIELNTEENRQKIKDKIPSKEQIKNLLQKGVDKAIHGYEIAKEKAKEFTE